MNVIHLLIDGVCFFKLKWPKPLVFAPFSSKRTAKVALHFASASGGTKIFPTWNEIGIFAPLFVVVFRELNG